MQGSDRRADRSVTATDGTFTIRECLVYCLVGARAEGHAARRNLYWLEGKRGSTEHVRIELRPERQRRRRHRARPDRRAGRRRGRARR
jgi:hypothetical protein